MAVLYTIELGSLSFRAPERLTEEEIVATVRGALADESDLEFFNALAVETIDIEEGDA